jgi:hypothetical protein
MPWRLGSGHREVVLGLVLGNTIMVGFSRSTQPYCMDPHALEIKKWAPSGVLGRVKGITIMVGLSRSASP